MPFNNSKKKPSKDELFQQQQSVTYQNSYNDKPKLVFHCQLAHGSPTGLIAGFSNVKELYLKIAECYDIDSKQVLLLTIHLVESILNNLV